MNDKNTKDEIKNDLEELSKFDSSSRTKISKLKELLPIIENAIQSGVSKTKIVEVLNNKGLKLTLSSYVIMMKRLQTSSNIENRISKSVSDDIKDTNNIKDKKELPTKDTKSLKLVPPFISPKIHDEKRIEDENSNN